MPGRVNMTEDGSTSEITSVTSLQVYTITSDVLGNVTYFVPYLKHTVESKLCSKTNITGEWCVFSLFPAFSLHSYRSKDVRNMEICSNVCLCTTCLS